MPKAALSRSEWLDVLIVLGVAAMGLCALAAPTWFLSISPSCLFTTLTGHHCWGCGMTRAVVAALKGDFARAWQYNGMVVVVLPLLFAEYFRLLRRVIHAVSRVRTRAVPLAV